MVNYHLQRSLSSAVRKSAGRAPSRIGAQVSQIAKPLIVESQEELKQFEAHSLNHSVGSLSGCITEQTMCPSQSFEVL